MITAKKLVPVHKQAITTQFPEHSDDRSPPMDTTTQNVINNAVDAQDDEDDRTHNWLELLCNFVQWICCRRY